MEGAWQAAWKSFVFETVCQNVSTGFLASRDSTEYAVRMFSMGELWRSCRRAINAALPAEAQCVLRYALGSAGDCLIGSVNRAT